MLLGAQTLEDWRFRNPFEALSVGVRMKRIVLVFVALFALSSCVTVVPPTTDPPLDPIEGPQAPGEPEDPALEIVTASELEVVSGSTASHSYSLSRDAQVMAWVEDTVIDVDASGYALGLEPFDQGFAVVTPSLRFSSDRSEYIIDFDGVDLEGLSLQFDLFGTLYEVFERNGDLHVVRPLAFYSVTENDPRTIGSRTLGLVNVTQVVTRDDGVASAQIRFSYDGSDPAFRTVRMNSSSSIAPGVTATLLPSGDESVVLVRLQGYGFDSVVEIEIGTTVNVEFGPYEFMLGVEGVMMDRDSYLLATVTDGEVVFSVAEYDMFSLGDRTLVVSSISTRIDDRAPALVNVIETEHVVRFSDDGFERWGPQGYAPGESIVGSGMELSDGLLGRVVVLQEHGVSADDHAFGAFVVRQKGDERLVSSTDAYVDALEDSLVSVTGNRPGSYSLVLDASDDAESVQAMVGLRVLSR